ncbi:NAD-dependent epimerase/dehydratase, partial [Streptomyces kunmingensis]
PADLPAGCRALPLDAVRCDPAALAAGLGALRPGLVVNAAGALWNVTDRELTEGNVLLVERLVRAVTTLPGPVRLVHIGSAYEYGAQAGPSRLTETLHARPAGRYAQTKLAGTRIVTEAAAGGLLDAVVLRIAVAVGPFASRHSLLGGLARQLAEGPVELTLPPIAGVRDLVDVRDVADAVLAAARVRRAPALVNIGSGTGVRLTEAVDTLIRIAGPRAATARVVRGPAPTVRRDTGIGEQALDIGLARRELGWAPARTLTDALHALWDSVQDTAPASPTTLAATLAVDGETIHG